MNRQDPDEMVRLTKAALETLMELARIDGFKAAINELRSERFLRMSEALSGDFTAEEIAKYLESLVEAK